MSSNHNDLVNSKNLNVHANDRNNRGSELKWNNNDTDTVDKHNHDHNDNVNFIDKGPLVTVRMKSLLDIEEPSHGFQNNGSMSTSITRSRMMPYEYTSNRNSSNNNNNSNENHSNKNQNQNQQQQREEEHQRYLSNLSPSSMDVAFSDPYKIDHSAFSRRQSAQTAIVISDKNRHGHNNDKDYDNNNDSDSNNDDEEQKRDEYVRSGTHFRSLLDCAFQKISNGLSKNELNENNINQRFIRGGDGDNDDIDGDSDGRGVDYNDEGDASLNVLQNGISKHSTMIQRGRQHQLRKRPLTDRLDSSRPLSRRRLEDLKEQEEEDDDEEEENNVVGRRLTAQLAREKMSEVLALKRALKEAEEHASAMSHANATLREASAASTARINTLTESLKITSSKVADSRADADMARAKVTSLGTQLKSLKCALDETKRTCESIRSEHDDIQSSARTLEAKLVQTESELQRVEKESFETQQERDSLRYELDECNQKNKRIRLTLEKKEDELLKLKKNIVERNDVERARIDRTNRLENELRDARSMLVEVTSAAKDAESTNVDLQNTIQHLQRENKSLHDKIEDIMDSSMREKTKLQEALGEAESGAQKLRMKAATDEEELHRIKLDQVASEKEVTQLQNRISNLEGRLKDAISSAGVVSPNDENGPKNSSRTASSSSYKTPARRPSSSSNRLSSLSKSGNSEAISGYNKESDFMIPPLRPSLSDISNTVVQTGKNHSMKKTFGGGKNGSKLSSVKCSICLKNAYGMMKSCQCGNPACDKRAHASCIASKKPLPSVSHPGTPAPRLPCILCNIGR